jgi:uncharacterized protein with HEPN domain
LPHGRYPAHGYHKVDDEIVWNTVKDKLPPMKKAILKALRPETSAESNLEAPFIG